MTTDSKIRGQCLKLIGAGFWIFVLVFVSRDFEVSSQHLPSDRRDGASTELFLNLSIEFY